MEHIYHYIIPIYVDHTIKAKGNTTNTHTEYALEVLITAIVKCTQTCTHYKTKHLYLSKCFKFNFSTLHNTHIYSYTRKHFKS